jgi:hypothetical protein
VLLIGPSFALLYTLQGRRLLHADQALPAVTLAGRTQPPATPPGQMPAHQNPVIRAAVLTAVVLAAFSRRRQHR